jgi:hypothetical protein
VPKDQPAPPPLALREGHIDRDHVVGTWRNVFINVWRHQTEERAVLNLKPVIEALKAAHPAGIAMLTVVEPDAELPTPGARRELPKLLKDVAQGVACSALVFEGVGFRAAAVRALTTTFTMLASPPFPHRVFSDVSGAAAMFVERMPPSAAGERLAPGELERTVSAFRARLDAPHGASLK